ncbi:MAG TPA: hypothetical protein VF350_01665 [Candidatus Bathyarchaeia archaeon]
MIGFVQQQSLLTTRSLSRSSLMIEIVVAELVLKEILMIESELISMFKENCGKLMVYASTDVPKGKRLESVRTAAKETAKRLNLDFEVVRLDRASLPIYVYYEENDCDEPIPLYCDEGKISGLEEISCKLRNMMFVLSFHPKHSVLKEMRSELLKLS